MRKLITVALGLFTLTSCTTMPTLSPTATPEEKRAYVECQGAARQGAGDGFGLLHQLEVNRLYALCMEGRGWVAQR